MKITVNNANCKITGSSQEVKDKLQRLLSYIDQSVDYQYRKKKQYVDYLAGNPDNPEYKKQKYLMMKLAKERHVNLMSKCEFPTGLLPKVERFLQLEGVKYSKDDTRVLPKMEFKYKARFFEPRYYQKDAVEAAVDKHRGVIVSPTGTGKSFMISKIIWELGVSTIVVTPSKEITEMMFDTLVKTFGKGKVQKLTTKSKKTKPIAVVNIQALVKIDPKLLGKIDCMIIDEFHHSSASTYREVNENHLKDVYFRFGVTATNFRSDGSDMALQGVLSDVLYEYRLQQAMDDGFLVPLEVRIERTKCPSARNYQTEYRNGIVENAPRNQKIIDISKEMIDRSIIILVQRIEHGETLRDMIEGSRFIYGKEKQVDRNRAMEDFRKGEVRVLIGINSILGEGVDLPIAEVLIMAGGGKSRGQVMQNVGRVLRLSPGKEKALVVDFTDEGSNHLSRHSLERQSIYDEY